MCKHPARLIHALTALAVLAVTASAFAADRPPRDQPGRLFRIVNATFDSVTALEIETGATGDGARRSALSGERGDPCAVGART